MKLYGATTNLLKIMINVAKEYQKNTELKYQLLIKGVLCGIKVKQGYKTRIKRLLRRVTPLGISGKKTVFQMPHLRNCQIHILEYLLM